jgi:hypothetical protein
MHELGVLRSELPLQRLQALQQHAVLLLLPLQLSLPIVFRKLHRLLWKALFFLKKEGHGTVRGTHVPQLRPAGRSCTPLEPLHLFITSHTARALPGAAFRMCRWYL